MQKHVQHHHCPFLTYNALKKVAGSLCKQNVAEIWHYRLYLLIVDTVIIIHSSSFSRRGLKQRSYCGRFRRVTAVDGRNVPSTAVERDGTCAITGDGVKNLALKACCGRRRRAQC